MRKQFIGLSISFKDRVDQWTKMPRTSSKVGKEAVSVYKHSTTKGFLLVAGLIAILSQL